MVLRKNYNLLVYYRAALSCWARSLGALSWHADWLRYKRHTKVKHLAAAEKKCVLRDPKRPLGYKTLGPLAS